MRYPTGDFSGTGPTGAISSAGPNIRHHDEYEAGSDGASATRSVCCVFDGAIRALLVMHGHSTAPGSAKVSALWRSEIIKVEHDSRPAFTRGLL